MKIAILDALTFGEIDLSAFDALGEVSLYQTTTPEQTQERIIEADVIVTNKVVITQEQMRAAKNLKLIAIAATGMNNVDLNAAKELAIEVKNVAGYSTDSVIQHTFSMLFYLIGHSSYYDSFVKDSSYAKSPIFTNISRPFFEIKGKKWGIIGLGAIGRGVASVASAFGAELLYHSTSGALREEPYKSVSLETLMSSCDIISIHAPLNEQTQNLLGYKELSQCKEGAVILNLGRGGIIDEEAVARIIDERDISFGLDVLEREPIRENHPLMSIKNSQNLYITPHIAWASTEARERLIELIIENIKSSI